MDYEITEGLTEAHDADLDYYGGALEIDAPEMELFEIMGV